MKKALFCSLLSVKLLSFEDAPWFDFPYEIHFRPSFQESYYSSIDHGSPNLSIYEHSFNEQLNLNLGVVLGPAVLSQLDVQAEVELFQTRATHFTLESLGTQARYQLLDDVTGDPISLTVGTAFRFVPDHALKDPYMPYHNLFNFEANLALGKEFDKAFNWVKRMYLFANTGIANEGSAWLKAKGLFEMHRFSNVFGGSLIGYYGFGNQRSIDLSDFHGYGSIAHQSWDLGVFYRYMFDIWGTLSIEASYRVFARSFPKNFLRLEIRYNLPFSFF